MTDSTKKPVTTMLTYPWKCTVLHCNHLGNTWKPLVLMTRHFDHCPSASEGDNQSVRSSAPVVSRCFPGGYNVKLYISRGRLAWWLLAFLHSNGLSALSTTMHYSLNNFKEDWKVLSAFLPAFLCTYKFMCTYIRRKAHWKFPIRYTDTGAHPIHIFPQSGF